MNSQLLGTIIAWALLGLVFFIAVCYIVVLTVEYIVKNYFAAKLAFVLMLKETLDGKPLDELKETFEAAMKRHSDGAKVDKS